jgi:hypothetical protein
MKNDKDFDISSFFTNDKYKSRAILFVYLIVFVILIMLVRFNNTPEKNSKENNSTQEKEEAVHDDDLETINYDEMVHTIEEENDSNSLYNRFSFLRINNYSFVFDVKIEKEFVVTGNRYDNKYKMVLENINDNAKIDYVSKNGKTKANLKGEYENVDLPITYIDYFDNVNLYNILMNSKKVEQDGNKIKYSITNSKLEPFILDDYISLFDENKDNENEIIIYVNENNKINQIDMNLINVSSIDDEHNSVLISLKYDNFAKINDFEVDF